ncbi:MAG: LOG family protein [Candidatus Omnitrophica bacterium]|nr:LOG family protein [Candidatus Omnitrophota bacterium]
MTKIICVFGSYKSLGKKDNDILKLGRLLAEKGFTVMTGGFGGTMELISRGAKEAGGKTIGVTYYKYEDVKYKKPNKYIDEEIRAKDIFERIDIMMKKADAFIALPGGTGTLLELAACIEHVNKGLMKPKPIIALGNFWKNVLERLTEEPVLSGEARIFTNALSCHDLVTFVDTTEEAVSKIATV